MNTFWLGFIIGGGTFALFGALGKAGANYVIKTWLTPKKKDSE
jgi:hypothetical protein